MLPVMHHKAGPAQLRRLLDAVLTIGSDLDLHTVLRTIATAATDLVDARYGALGVLNESSTGLSDFITVGVDDEQRHVIGNLPEGHGILGLLIVEPHPRRLTDLTDHAEAFGFPPGHPPMTTFLGVPITVRGTVFGNLYLCDKADGGAFTEVDEELVVDLASAAAIAIENARLHSASAELATLNDRERIARDLHDVVIQRLFATGLSLQAAVRHSTDELTRTKLLSAVDDLDATVRDIRATIFELHTARPPGRSIRAELAELCSEAARALGFDPTVRFDGPIDAALAGTIIDDLFAVTRESLANVAKHARATTADVEIAMRDGQLVIRVSDNGVGYRGSGGVQSGLNNLRSRAERRRGRFEVNGVEGVGTDAIWSVPLDVSLSAN